MRLHHYLFKTTKTIIILIRLQSNPRCIWRTCPQIDENAELSFVMDTRKEKKYFEIYWKIFLKLIEKIAHQLGLNQFILLHLTQDKII